MSQESLYDIEILNIHGQTQKMEEFKGKVLLIVNTASKCGFTPQYKGLEELYQKYKAKGFEVLGFPCNQFGGQEPGNEEEIKNFCDLTYKVTFPMFSKIKVNGKEAHPLFVYLKSRAKGILGTEAIKWNFTKFLVDKEGNVIDRFASNTAPESLGSEIEKLV
ncbi:MAG: glutathione peroxidase [Silvanigrellaceae bacterium]|nr:glutathione peroxidase [Silvanigrellaceae bacterium]